MKFYNADPESLARAYPCAREAWGIFGPGDVERSCSWLRQNLGQHIEVMLAEDDEGEIAGATYWSWSERSLSGLVVEPGVAHIKCVWVWSMRQKQGVWKGMLGALANDLGARGAKGILVAATEFAGYMHRSHFEKAGFRLLGELPGEGSVILFYPLSQESVRFSPRQMRLPCADKGMVLIHIFDNFLCPLSPAIFGRVERIGREFGERVKTVHLPASLDSLEKYGVAGGFYINGKEKIMGPASDQEIRRAIEEELS